MNKAKMIAVAGLVALATAAAAQPRPMPGRRPQPAAVRQDIREEQEKVKKFKTGEGAIDRTQWTEYTVNPSAKGACTLVMVLGGRDALGSAAMPEELPELIAYAKSQLKGKVVFVVPKPSGIGKGAGGRTTRGGAVFGGENALTIANLPKVVRHFAERHGVAGERVLATGASMGGHQLLGLLNDDPGLVAKALVVASAASPASLGDVRAQVRLVHGDDDDAIPLFKAQTTVDAINKLHPGRAELVVAKGRDHVGAMKAAFERKENLKWLFN